MPGLGSSYSAPGATQRCPFPERQSCVGSRRKTSPGSLRAGCRRGALLCRREELARPRHLGERTKGTQNVRQNRISKRRAARCFLRGPSGGGGGTFAFAFAFASFALVRRFFLMALALVLSRSGWVACCFPDTELRWTVKRLLKGS